MSIIKHLESFLGSISKGWKDPVAFGRLQVASFENQPFEDARTYCTIGLSDTVLPMGESYIRQELLFSAEERFHHEHIASFLSTFAESIVCDNRALLRGDVVGPSAPIIFGTLMNAVYAAIPMVYAEGLTVYGESDPATVIAWIVPIHETEAHFVRTHGWKAFEDLLEQNDPNLWNLHRDSLV